MCKAGEYKGKLSVIYQTPIVLKGHWEVGVTQLLQPKSDRKFFVMCDLVDYSYINNMKHRFLQFVNNDKVDTSSSYVSVTKKVIESINIELFYVKDMKLTEYSVNDNDSNEDLICELHFRKS